MKKLYEKSEIWFAVAWIIVYVVVMGNLRNQFEDGSLYSMLAALAIAVTLTVFIIKNRLTEKFGLILWTDSKKYLYFIPFILLCSVNLWFGVSLHYSIGQGSLDTFFQMGYAIAIGFAFVMVFYKSGSLVPCIATHAIVNMTSKFSNHNIPEQAEMVWGYGSFLFIVLVAGGYALYLRKVDKDMRIDSSL